MRKAQKQEVMECINSLHQAHIEIREALERNEKIAVQNMLSECQEFAVSIGESIEKLEGEGHAVVSFLEGYCETVYRIYNELDTGAINAHKSYKTLRQQLLRVESSARNDIPVRREVVFLPYKASMWDSLESVWMAADADPDCDAYVIPIPYYDRNPDGSLGTYHYEGNEIPSYVPITHYESYHIEEQKPDAVYIHNPYDNTNLVTTVDPRFYSDKLKENTECLVYIPYYSTTGGMSEGQTQCSAYYHADYIVIQAPKYRKFFDPALPDRKFLPLGSPKFDRVIRMCENPPEPPAEWKDKLKDKKVYFYNTSIAGMLGGTEQFLRKMEYVFRCFQGREDACLIWRPHPLLESSFDSMRKWLRPAYDKLKQDFIDSGIGIYDDTPDIEHTIALSDAYIGDAGTSVTSLFGMAGKPIFILNNRIHQAPGEDDWRGEIIKGFALDGYDEWMITQGNKLYHSPNKDYRYQYYCDLTQYSYGNYYSRAIEANGKVYVCPANAQDILVIEEGEIKKRIPLKRVVERGGSFAGAWKVGDSIFLIPWHYPAIVRYDILRDKVEYIEGYNSVFVRLVNGEWKIGGSCVWKSFLLLASPVDTHVLVIDSKTGKAQVLVTGAENTCGCLNITPDDRTDDVWIMPYSGKVVTKWNPVTGEVREYSDLPAGFQCKNRPQGFLCEDRPFGIPAFCKNYVYLAPSWGNMFLRLDRDTGKIEKWIPPFPVLQEGKSCYYGSDVVGYFLQRTDASGEGITCFFSYYDKRFYEMNLETEEYREIAVEFDRDKLQKQEPGFWEESEWFQYACEENAFNSLERFLDNEILGNPFDKERQIVVFGKIAANNDGTSGEKIHRFVRGKI